MRIYKLSDNSKEYINTFYQILESMKDAMSSVPVQNDLSIFFINTMIPHHQAAIEMSENILRFTTNPDIESLARAIIASQTDDIQQMEQYRDSCAKIENSQRDVLLYDRAYKEIYLNMVAQMERACTSNNLNVCFLNEMLPHHEGAIAMSKNLLRFDACPELKNLMEKLIATQSQQANLMREYLKMLT